VQKLLKSHRRCGWKTHFVVNDLDACYLISGMTFEFAPIGFIQTPFKERFGTPRQPGLTPSSWGELTLSPNANLNGSFEGLEGFSHVWLIWVFHQNTNKVVRGKIHPPRLEGEKIGLFATRTPHRPNPIGLSLVKLDRVEGATLHFSGVDLVDGTPILDIKPYVAEVDFAADARAGWTSGKPVRSIEVDFSNQAVTDLRKHVAEPLQDRFQALIREVLELDPRPTFYKGSEASPNPYTDLYGFRLDHTNVVYRMDGRKATVVEIQLEDGRPRATSRGNLS
jgi:tRNA-Thr(GGU) m(6)t(6)A37 methyltransferase TsaA